VIQAGYDIPAEPGDMSAPRRADTMGGARDAGPENPSCSRPGTARCDESQTSMSVGACRRGLGRYGADRFSRNPAGSSHRAPGASLHRRRGAEFDPGADGRAGFSAPPSPAVERQCRFPRRDPRRAAAKPQAQRRRVRPACAACGQWAGLAPVMKAAAGRPPAAAGERRQAAAPVGAGQTQTKPATWRYGPRSPIRPPPAATAD